jgi:hypothetical protein
MAVGQASATNTTAEQMTRIQLAQAQTRQADPATTTPPPHTPNPPNTADTHNLDHMAKENGQSVTTSRGPGRRRLFPLQAPKTRRLQDGVRPNGGTTRGSQEGERPQGGSMSQRSVI